MMQSKKFQRGNSIAAMGGRNMRDSSFSTRDILNLTNQDSSQITGSTTMTNKHEMHGEKDIKKK